MEYEKTIREQILKDADGKNSYTEDIVNNGCVGGNCRGLVYYKDTHAFYNHFADEIDEILDIIAEEAGESYNITENMDRLNQNDLRNFLVWFAYEVEAQKIINERSENKESKEKE